ncbi:4-alpha-glucan branching enzyme GlgB [Striga asiatica]|uniref:4-alpha-glucan branching enzyme GlgB n=1 Tax=Striga asiatica TaxID=4170 RepID=A0A5A7P7F4_STRAF|nr:4-alpha-glucan branching enzyme GlgB [Striga asiatica]
MIRCLLFSRYLCLSLIYIKKKASIELIYNFVPFHNPPTKELYRDCNLSIAKCPYNANKTWGKKDSFITVDGNSRQPRLGEIFCGACGGEGTLFVAWDPPDGGFRVLGSTFNLAFSPSSVGTRKSAQLLLIGTPFVGCVETNFRWAKPKEDTTMA